MPAFIFNQADLTEAQGHDLGAAICSENGAEYVNARKQGDTVVRELARKRARNANHSHHDH